MSYGPEATAEVTRIVELERIRCAFLTFDVKESAEVVDLTVTAPERDGTDAQCSLAQFLPAAAPLFGSASKANEWTCCRG